MWSLIKFISRWKVYEMEESYSYWSQKKIETDKNVKNRMCLTKWKNSGMKRIEFERRKCGAFNR